ncbi:tubulin delta chain isoform X3 [Patella vulgata]|nr:tubulin delta chain isoform X3 [Patella vulgata]XP_055957926.1 tubulin delta chain isoform X3 [Patella vulgata]
MILHHLVGHPEYKLLTIRNIPQMSDRSMEFSSFHWPGLLKHLRQMLVADAAMEEGIDWQVNAGDETPRGSVQHNRSLANMLVLRGKDVISTDTSSYLDPKLYTSWTDPELGFSKLIQPRAFNSYEKCAALISNSRSPIRPLNHIIDKAWNMFAARAYVHQYTQHGLNEEDFIDGFVTLEQVLASYKKL